MMPNVYEGQPDVRQSDDEKLIPSRFRPRYRSLKEDEVKLHDAIKDQATKLERLYGEIGRGSQPNFGVKPEGQRCLALSLTKLEESVMWAVKALTL